SVVTLIFVPRETFPGKGTSTRCHRLLVAHVPVNHEQPSSAGAAGRQRARPPVTRNARGIIPG
ncbi:MAG TPA: hypothetical protein PLH06_13970, partial [Candidatus Hydrogenedentes bacterium]|nr:hypothetical protein [Candidatus Hydrogenedentota bacterium]